MNIKKGTDYLSGKTEGTMTLSRHTSKIAILLGDLFLIILSIKIAQWVRFGRYYDIFTMETGASYLTIFIFPVTFYIFDLYAVQRGSDGRNLFKRMVLAILVASPLLGVLFYALPQFMFGRGVFLILLGSVLGFCLLWRYLLLVLLGNRSQADKLLFVGTHRSCQEFDELLAEQVGGYQVMGWVSVEGEKDDGKCRLPLLGRVDSLFQIAKEAGARMVVIDNTVRRQRHLVQLMLEMRFSGIAIRTVPDLFEDVALKIPVKEIEDDWLLFAHGFHHLFKEYMIRLKRISDCVISGLLLLLLWPLMLLVGLAIKLDSSGNMLYRQERVGLYGKTFEILKFRSMREDGEKDGAVWARENDDRITRVGHWIRLCRLDELPQLINVLKGDMSLVGPRPERPEFTGMLEKEIPYYSLRHMIRPGVTGWAQIRYRYGASVEDSLKKLEYDLYYVKNLSLFLDIKICLKTVGVIILGDGAR